MKKNIFYILLLVPFACFSQNSKDILTVNSLYGNIIKHNKNIGTYLEGHPTGFLLEWDKTKTSNFKNFKTGIDFLYQDYKSTFLGKQYGLYTHYDFAIFNFNNNNTIRLKTSAGITYVSKIYNKATNPKNTAFGSHINFSTYVKLEYKRLNLIKNIGINLGLMFTHVSNGRMKSPNTGVNTWLFTAGINRVNTNKSKLQQTKENTDPIAKTIKYNALISGGVNESIYTGTGVKPFFVITTYASKQISKKSALHLGTDLFVSYILKDDIELSKILYNKPTRDFKRIGVFVGHEFIINRQSIVTQLGHYIYPKGNDETIYERIGLKHYFNNKYYFVINLKAHGARAESFAFGFGIKK